MDIKFSKDMDENQQQSPGEEKGRKNILLVVVLILVGGFAYVYFFTGLIRQQEEQQPAKTPASQVVKNVLPPRESLAPQVAQTSAPGAKQTPKSPVKPENPKVVPEPAAKEALKPPSGEPKKTAPVKSVEKKDLSAPADKKELKPITAKTVEKKQVLAEGKPIPVTSPPLSEKKETALKKPLANANKKAPEGKGDASNGRWVLVVGSYLLEDALSNDLVRVRKAGLEAAVEPGAKKKTTMNRLFLAEYDDRSEARGNLEKLKRYTSDAFIIDQGGKFALYAGSYLLDIRAMSEKERLGAAGFNLTLKRVEVAIPTKRLTAGKFNNKKTAETALRKLKDAGINASLSGQ